MLIEYLPSKSPKTFSNIYQAEVSKMVETFNEISLEIIEIKTSYSVLQHVYNFGSKLLQYQLRDSLNEVSFWKALLRAW